MHRMLVEQARDFRDESSRLHFSKSTIFNSQFFEMSLKNKPSMSHSLEIILFTDGMSRIAEASLEPRPPCSIRNSITNPLGFRLRVPPIDSKYRSAGSVEMFCLHNGFAGERQGHGLYSPSGLTPCFGFNGGDVRPLNMAGPRLSYARGGTGWLALEPTCVPWHKRYLPDKSSLVLPLVLKHLKHTRRSAHLRPSEPSLEKTHSNLLVDGGRAG